MKIAIYSRKSKFTGKGESIENQITMCKDYSLTHFGVDEKDLFIYEDEGFSGGSFDRPQFQIMLKDAKKKKFDILMCYRLDRISRNIADFSNLINELQEYNISFVSIREQFDTTTPMGRAMMYISSVFAQLERETIAERLRDNLHQLAKTGRWLGGITPTGFEAKQIEYASHDNKLRKGFMLSPIESELNTVRIIYDEFIKLGSLTKLETYLIKNGYKSKNNLNYKRETLKLILTNPVYVIADKNIYNYFTSNNYNVCSTEDEFNGINGIMTYCRTKQTKQKKELRSNEEWIIAVGAHNGIIKSENWLKVQSILKKNSSKSFRVNKTTSSILSGLIVCGNCGSFMRPKTGRINQDGEQVYYYLCEQKDRSKGELCKMKNAKGNDIDRVIIDTMKNLASGNDGVESRIFDEKVIITENKNKIENSIKSLEKKINNTKKSIESLVSTLSESQNTGAAKYIVEQINKLDSENAVNNDELLRLKNELEMENEKETTFGIIHDIIKTYNYDFDSMTPNEKRNVISRIVDKIVWNGKSVDIQLFGVKSLNKLDMLPIMQHRE